MTNDLDSRITSQLALHRGLHSLAGPLIATLREKLMMEKLQRENAKQSPDLKVTTSLEAIDRWNELAEKVEFEPRPWT